MTLERPVLAALLINATHEIDMDNGRRATIYYETETLAHMRRPDGVVMTGDWSLCDDGYVIAWRDGPTASWTIKADPGRITYFDADGNDRGSVRSIVYGNAAVLPA